METLLVLTNCPDEETANAIALAVVEAKLAACVNICRASSQFIAGKASLSRRRKFPFLSSRPQHITRRWKS